MKWNFFTGFMLSTLFSLAALGQEVQKPKSEPSPSPKPSAPRRTLDQFDIGVSLPTAQSSTTIEPEAGDPIDASICHGVIRLIGYSSSIERQYMAASAEGISNDHYFHPENMLFRKLESSLSIIAMYEEGTLGEKMTGGKNLALLKTNRGIVIDMLRLLESMPYKDSAPYSGTVRTLADRYGVAPKDWPGSNKTYVEKRSLLAQMFTRLNGNFARLKAGAACPDDMLINL